MDEIMTQTEILTPEIPKEVLNFSELHRLAEMLAKSTIVPIAYQNRPENCFVALDMASRMGISALVVMQNLYVIQGKPSFSGSAISALVNSCPRYRDVELVYVGQEGTDSWGAYVTAIKVSNGKVVKGGTVTIGTAKREGWYSKSGSKWQTMPEMMLGYRAYAWFGRLYTPELLMGMQSTDEVNDVAVPLGTEPIVINPFEVN